MTTVKFTKKQLVGITELQRNAGAVSSKAKQKDILILKNNAPHVVIIDCDRYEKLMEKAEQADIYAMMLERRKDPLWLSTEDVLNGLSFAPEGKVEYDRK